MEFSVVNLFIAFGGGILSFVSPCVLPLIPMYLAYMTGVSVKDLDTDKKPIKKALLNSVFFVLGFTVIFTIFASIFYIIFDNLGGVRIWVDRAVALILIVFVRPKERTNERIRSDIQVGHFPRTLRRDERSGP